MDIKVRQFISSSEIDPSQVSIYASPVNNLGYMMSLVLIKTETDFDPSNIARFIWNAIIDEMTYLEEPDHLERLKKSIDISVRRITQQVSKNTEKNLDIDLILLSFFDDKLYFVKIGDPNFSILHTSELVDIANLLDQNEVHAGSVELNQNDLYILAAGDAFAKAQGYMKGLSPKDVLTAIYTNSGELEAGEGIVVASLGLDIDSLIEPNELLFPEVDLVSNSLSTKSDELPEGQTGQYNDPTKGDSAGISGEGAVDYATLDKQDEPVSQNREGLYNRLMGFIPVDLSRYVSNEKLKKGKDSLGKVSTGVALATTKTADFIGGGVSAGYAAIIDVLTGVLSKRYARSPRYKRLQARFSQSKISNYSVKGMRVGSFAETRTRNRRVGFAVLSILVALFGVYAYQQYQEVMLARQYSQEFQEMYISVDSLLDGAEQSIRGDRSAAQNSFAQAEELFKSYVSESKQAKLSDSDKARFDDLETRVLGVSDDLMKVTPVSEELENMELLVDTRLQFRDISNPTDIAIYQDTFLQERLVIADEGSAGVYVIDLNTVEVSELSTASDMPSPRYVDVGVNGVYVFDTEVGVLKAAFGENNSEIGGFSAVTGLGISSFGGADVSEFSVLTELDNVYTLSQQESAIYKSDGRPSGYSLPYLYLQDSEIAEPTDILADFSIYLVSDSANKITTYSFDYNIGRLVRQDLQITGLPSTLGRLTVGYTGSNLNDGMYVFDSTNSRIVHFEKPVPSENLHPGQLLFTKQYEYRGKESDVFDDIQDIVVDRAGEYAYVLDGTRIWKISL